MAADIQCLAQRYECLRQERSRWESAWAELARHFLPTGWRQDTQDNGHLMPPVLNAAILNATGILAMRTLAAGLQGGMTSPARPWFRLDLEHGSGGDSSGSAGAWLDEVTRRMQLLLHKSNCYNALHALYADLGTFGTGCLFETAGNDGLPVFTLVRAGEYCIDINAEGMVDTVFRRVHMTARQLRQEFGEENLPPVAAQAARGQGSTQEQRFNVIHAVLPREDARDYALKKSRRPFASVYFMYETADGTGKPWLLRESGYNSFPAFVPRWEVRGNDVYGASPAMDVLPDCRMLQQMSRTTLKAMHKLTDPPMLANSALRSVGLDLTPGSVTFADYGGLASGVAAAPLMQTEPAAIQAGMQAVTATEQKINDGLYVDLFKMLIASDRRQITATEIEAREQEKMVLIGPVVERLHKELFSPLIERTFAIMQENNLLPEIPEELQGAPLKVEFVSVLAQAQKLMSTSGLDQMLAYIANTAQLAPQALDVLNVDALLDRYAEDVGVSPSVLRSQEERDGLRQQRIQAQQVSEQQQQTAAGLQQMQIATQAAKNLGQTPLGGDGKNAMQVLLGGLGGV